MRDPMDEFDADEDGNLSYEEFEAMVEAENLPCLNLKFLPCNNDLDFSNHGNGNANGTVNGGNNATTSGNGDWVTDDALTLSEDPV